MNLTFPVERSAYDRGAIQRSKAFVDVATAETRGSVETTSELRLANGLPAVIRSLAGGDGWGLNVSLSVPRWLHGSNLFPAEVDGVWKVASEIRQELGEDFPWTSSLEQTRITRLDIARDFEGVTSPAIHLEGLSHIRPDRMSTHLFRDATHAGTQTLYREVKDRYQLRLYDRGVMYSNTKPEGWQELATQARGTLRFEAELKSAVLREAGARTLADLNPELVARWARSYWDRSMFGAVIGGTNERLRGAHEHALRTGQVARFRSVCSSMLLEHHGLQPLGTRNTIVADRKFAKEAGLEAGALVDDQLATAQLDFDLGRLIRPSPSLSSMALAA